jgi:hypothetical protein
MWLCVMRDGPPAVCYTRAMTVTQLHPYGRRSGICPECRTEIGNLPVHVPKCRARFEAFYAEADENTWRQTERAAAHSVAGESFRDGVTDLDVARVLLAIERGAQIVAGGPSRWFCETGNPLNRTSLARTVDEMIRTGLARASSAPVGRDYYSVTLIPAPVHLRSRRDALRARCGNSSLRLRRVDHLELIDCGTCRKIARPAY